MDDNDKKYGSLVKMAAVRFCNEKRSPALLSILTYIEFRRKWHELKGKPWVYKIMDISEVTGMGRHAIAKYMKQLTGWGVFDEQSGSYLLNEEKYIDLFWTEKDGKLGVYLKLPNGTSNTVTASQVPLGNGISSAVVTASQVPCMASQVPLNGISSATIEKEIEKELERKRTEKETLPPPASHKPKANPFANPVTNTTSNPSHEVSMPPSAPTALNQFGETPDEAKAHHKLKMRQSDPMLSPDDKVKLLCDYVLSEPNKYVLSRDVKTKALEFFKLNPSLDCLSVTAHLNTAYDIGSTTPATDGFDTLYFCRRVKDVKFFFTKLQKINMEIKEFFKEAGIDASLPDATKYLLPEK